MASCNTAPMFQYCSNSVPILFQYCSNTVPILFQYCSSTVQCSSNTVLIQSQYSSLSGLVGCPASGVTAAVTARLCSGVTAEVTVRLTAMWGVSQCLPDTDFVGFVSPVSNPVSSKV